MKRLALILLFVLVALPASAANRFLTCATACTITASDTTIWGTTTGGTGASVPGSSDAVVLDGATCVGGTTCTATMGAGYNPTWQSITMGACTASTTGCVLDFSVNNNSVTLSVGGMNGSGTGVRVLKLGNGTWTISGTTAATLWQFTTTTNLTFSANSSTISLTGVTASTRTFAGGGLTYNIVTFSANSSGGALQVTGVNTISSWTVTGPNYLQLSNGTTQTVTTLNLSGSSGSEIFVCSNTVGASATVSVASNAPTMTWAGFHDFTGTGGATFVATNSFDFGHNSGITITAPQTGGGGIIGGWLLRGDLNYDNDNAPMFLNKAA